MCWRVRRCEWAQEKSAHHSGLSVFTDLFVFCACLCVRVCVCSSERAINEPPLHHLLPDLPEETHCISTKMAAVGESMVVYRRVNPQGAPGRRLQNQRQPHLFPPSFSAARLLPLQLLQHADTPLVTSSPPRPAAESDRMTLHTIHTALCCQTKNCLLMFPSRIEN